METKDIIKNLKQKGSEILDVISEVDFVVNYINRDSIPIKDDIALLNKVAKYHLLTKEEFETLAGRLFLRDVPLDNVLIIVNYNDLTSRSYLTLSFNNAEITIDLNTPKFVRIYETYNDKEKYSSEIYKTFFEFWESHFPETIYIHEPYASDALLQHLNKNKYVG